MDMSTIWQHQRRKTIANAMTPNSGQIDDQSFLSEFYAYGNQGLEIPFYDFAPVQQFAPTWSQPTQPLERFMREDGPLVISSSFPMQNGFQVTNLDGISPLPHGTHHRMISPAPSQEQSSYCSSAQSPGADHDWYQKKNNSPGCYSPQSMAQDAPSLSHSNGGSQPNIDLHPLEHDNLAFHPSNYHQPTSFPAYRRDNMNSQGVILLNQVQSFPDHQESQEVTKEERHFEFETVDPNYYSYKDSNAPVLYATPDQMRNTYCHSRDEGIGASIQDSGSTHQNTPSVQNECIDVEVASTTYPDPDNDADADADADIDVDIEVDYQETSDDSDGEFQPTRNNRSRKPRRAAARSSKVLGLNTQNSRIQKSTSCKKAAAQRRSKGDSVNPRPFGCIFAFAGCKSDFPNKNEWKRHVSTQHVCLDTWICNQGACANNDQPNEFNRKDLFTQHLRRMHPPSDVKRNAPKKSTSNMEWEDRIKKLQKDCAQEKKNPPRKSMCPVDGCGVMFEGATREACKKAWDERMEHIGKHLDPVNGIIEVNHQQDPLLVEWAQIEGIVERVSTGWRLAGTGALEDIDAIGEEED